MIEDHVAAAREALRSNGLNDWELDFLRSMVHIRWPSEKQLNTLEALVAKAANWRPPRPSSRRRASRKARR